jgi:hypothetical protein
MNDVSSFAWLWLRSAARQIPDVVEPDVFPGFRLVSPYTIFSWADEAVNKPLCGTGTSLIPNGEVDALSEVRVRS